MHRAVAAALEAATAPSRELDAAVWLACFEPTCPSHEVEFHTEQYDYVSRTAIDCALGTMWVDQMEPPLRHYTSSAEDALALVSQMQPTFFWRVQKQAPDYTDGPFWAVCGPHGKPQDQSTAHGRTPALAVLGALMSALANIPSHTASQGETKP